MIKRKKKINKKSENIAYGIDIERSSNEASGFPKIENLVQISEQFISSLGKKQSANTMLVSRLPVAG